MPLTLQNIIDEADALVPNTFSNAQKAVWLNEANQQFFDIVKIPKVARFSALAETGTYVLASAIRSKNIDKVFIGGVKYLNMLLEDVQPEKCMFDFDDDTYAITLSPAPISDESGVVRYYRIATSSFSSVGSPGLSANPDAPPEYHWTYVPALCSKIAKAQDDLSKAANYENEATNALNVAAQNYPKGSDRG